MRAFHTIAVAAAALFVSGAAGSTAHAQIFGNLPIFNALTNNSYRAPSTNGNAQCGPNGCWVAPNTNVGVVTPPAYNYGNALGQNVPYYNNTQRYPTTYPGVGSNAFPNGPVPYNANRPDFRDPWSNTSNGNHNHNHGNLNHNNNYYFNGNRPNDVRDRVTPVQFQTPAPFQTFPVNYYSNGSNMR
ncbi:hypothetical protein [Planctomicrobium sp. SH527]|uniref:hypothetical protein n=1 Tax=Planctomicrobium sp. SH527 TaxID=3448123 RepID=UPI003F5BB86D